MHVVGFMVYSVVFDVRRYVSDLHCVPSLGTVQRVYCREKNYWTSDIYAVIYCCQRRGIMVAAWLSGSALVSINEVTVRRVRLVVGWVNASAGG